MRAEGWYNHYAFIGGLGEILSFSGEKNQCVFIWIYLTKAENVDNDREFA